MYILYNFTFLLSPIVTIALLIYFFYFTSFVTIHAFVVGQYVGYGLNFFLSLVFVVPLVNRDKKTKLFSFKEVFYFGFGSEISSSIQFLNYRLIFYVLHYQLGDAALGLFSVAVAMTESVWILSRSICVNQYAKFYIIKNLKI